jgi:sulfate/thiosulfate transport system substrate-binding protein
MRARGRIVGAVGVASLLVLAACGGGNDSSGGANKKITIVGYSVAEEASNAAEEAFADTPAGKGVSFEQSYGASGDQSRAVEGGQDADYVHFSLEPDVTRLVDAGLVADTWKDTPTKGIVSTSVVVFIVPKGNPDGIEDWDDLIKDGSEIITPNPGSSGAAKWNILAAYGHTIADGGSEDDAKAYLTSFFEHVAALPGSGRDATTAFKDGTGNVLISYENEAILGRQSGEDFDYVIPPTTLKIENPGAVLKDASAITQDWFDFVTSKDGQAIYASKGYRPVVDGVDVGEVEGANDPSNPFPDPDTLLTIDDDFGGWADANKTYFDEDDGIVPKIQEETGKTE